VCPFSSPRNQERLIPDGLPLLRTFSVKSNRRDSSDTAARP
jgi:hypothetical protein